MKKIDVYWRKEEKRIAYFRGDDAIATEHIVTKKQFLELFYGKDEYEIYPKLKNKSSLDKHDVPDVYYSAQHQIKEKTAQAIRAKYFKKGEERLQELNKAKERKDSYAYLTADRSVLIAGKKIIVSTISDYAFEELLNDKTNLTSAIIFDMESNTVYHDYMSFYDTAYKGYSLEKHHSFKSYVDSIFDKDKNLVWAKIIFVEKEFDHNVQFVWENSRPANLTMYLSEKEIENSKCMALMYTLHKMVNSDFKTKR